MTQPMTQQQPFKQEGPIMTKLAEHEQMNRFEKVEFLQETTTTEFHTATLLTELISWMPEQDFSRFYDDFCSNWDVCRSHEELNEKYGE